MDTKHWTRMSLSCALAVAALVMPTTAINASPTDAPLAKQEMATVTTVGNVNVNGNGVPSGAAIYPGSSIQTGENASATLALSNNSRLDIQPNTALNVDFSDKGVRVNLASGNVRVVTPSGLASTVTTKDSSISSNLTTTDSYVVDFQCNQTEVASFGGSVTLVSGNVVKNVATSEKVMSPAPQDGSSVVPGARCFRKGVDSSSSSAAGPLTASALTALLLSAGGAVATAIVAVTNRSNDDLNFGGTVTVVSPTR